MSQSNSLSAERRRMAAIRFLGAAAMTGALVMAAAPASAQLAVADFGVQLQLQQGFQQTAQSITQAISQQTSSLSQDLTTLRQGLANAISGAADTNSQASAAAARVVTQGAQRTASEQATIVNEQHFSGVDPCNVLVASMGSSAVARSRVTATGGGGGGGAPRSAPGGTNGMDAVLNVAEARQVAAAPEVEANRAARAACSTFASGGVRGQACADAGFPTSNSAGFPNADTRASTLFDGPQTGADGTAVVRRLTVDLSGPDGTAIRALMRNLDSPLQLKDLTPSQRNSDAGRQYMALMDAFMARMSVAKYPQEAQANLLAAKTETIPMIQQMLKSDDAAYVQAYLTQNAPNWSSKGISFAELINLEVERRYANPAWALRMLTATDSDIARENVRLLAFNAWISSMSLDRQIVAAVNSSSMAEATIRSEMMPALVAAHDRAVNR